MRITPSSYVFKIFKCTGILIIYWLLLIVLSSSIHVRNWVVAPLVVHHPDAQGEACYILAGGGAIWERLDAGADLVQMGRVETLIIMGDDSVGSYSFKDKASWPRTKWLLDYLAWRGVPSSKVTVLDQADGTFGTLSEARNVAKHLPEKVKTLVVVSSTPHMRRSILAFERSLQSGVRVVPYAATTFEDSYEMYHPIWVEYLKLLVYWVVA